VQDGFQTPLNKRAAPAVEPVGGNQSAELCSSVMMVEADRA
jgi:hypothetical protein